MTFDIVIKSIFSTFFLASVIRICTPIILPSLGGLVASAAGVSHVALEGIMLWGAFTGVFVSAFTGNVWLAVLAGCLVGILVALLLAFAHLRFGSDRLLAGLAINLFSSGGTVFLMYSLIGEKGNTSTLASLSVPNVIIPIIHDIPILGPIISGHPVFTYLAFFLVWVIYILMYRTRLGVHMRAVGENAEAATTMGINVNLVRYIAFAISGFMSALGGMSLSMAYLQVFQREMAAGRGYIGIAAVRLGGGHPVGTMLSAMLFGVADALANQLGSLNIPSQFVQSIPYATTVIGLAVFAIQKRRAEIERRKKYMQEEVEEVAA